MIWTIKNMHSEIFWLSELIPQFFVLFHFCFIWNEKLMWEFFQMFSRLTVITQRLHQELTSKTTLLRPQKWKDCETFKSALLKYLKFNHIKWSHD
jgi:hypothetical protein